MFRCIWYKQAANAQPNLPLCENLQYFYLNRPTVASKKVRFFCFDKFSARANYLEIKLKIHVFQEPNPLSLTQSENYSFVASFDKISSNNKNLPIKFLKFFRGLKPPQNIYTPRMLVNQNSFVYFYIKCYIALKSSFLEDFKDKIFF